MPALTALIPLDGTKLSESAFSLLPLVRSLGVDKVVLVSVWESLWQAEDLAHGDKELKELEEKGRAYLHAYLSEQEAKVKALDFETETMVRVGRAADELVNAAGAADLVILATHGRNGITRWRLGSVADKVVRHAGCPTLVIGPNVHIDLASYKVQRILVPLDGSDLAEQALPVATWIAQTTGAELDLVRVVSLVIPGDGVYNGMGYSADILSNIEDAARSYLAGVAERLKAKVPVRTELLLGAAADQLLAHITETPAELVVLASHGRAGVIRATLGSVADRMLHGPAPALILRPEQAESRFVEAARSAAEASRST
jgi:nucleotide-binding universal stress UspA family protein